MERAVFTHHETDMPTLPHREVRWAMSRGRSVVVEGFEIGKSQEDKAFLADLTGATFAGRVRFKKCVFLEHIDLSDTTFEQTLHFRECEIRCGLYMMDTVVGGRCSLRGSQIWDKERFWLNWRGLKTGRGLHLIGVTTHAPIDLYQALIGGDLHLSGLWALAAWQFNQDARTYPALKPIERHHIIGEMLGKAINLDGGLVGGHVNAGPYLMTQAASENDPYTPLTFRSIQLRGSIDLRASIGGDVRIGTATITAARGRIAVNLEHADVKGSVFFANATHVIGSINLRARIDGTINFDRATVDAGTGRVAINMAEAAVGKSVFFVDSTRVVGTIDLRASVDGQIGFKHSTVCTTPAATAVRMDAARVGGSVFFGIGTRITGSIDLRATIGGQVDFDGATVHVGAGITALDMDAATVGGSLLFGNGTLVTGSLDLRASIVGQLNFDGATIIAAANEKAISVDAATVGGPMFLHGGTTIVGHVSLFQSKLAAGLFSTDEVTRDTFDRPGGPGKNHRISRECLIVGNLFLEHTQSEQSVRLHGLSVLGMIHARHLRVAGDLQLCGGVAGTMDEASHKKAHTWIVLTTRAVLLHHLGSRWSAVPSTHESNVATAIFLSGAAAFRMLAKRIASTDQHGWQAWELKSTPKEPNQPGKNPDGPAINLELADIQGHLWIRGQRVLGTVNAELAHVKGDASFDRSLIEGDLVLRDAKVDGKLFAQPAAEGEPAPLVRGKIDASSGSFETVVICLGDADKQADGLAKWYLFDSATVGSFFVFGHLGAKGRKLFSMHRLVFQDLRLDKLDGSGFKWFLEGDKARLVLTVGLAALVLGALGLGAWAPGSLYVLGFLIGFLVFAAFVWAGSIKARRSGPSRPLLDFLHRSRFSAAFHIDAEHWARAGGDEVLADGIFLERRRRELKERRPGADEHGEPAEWGDDPGFHWFTKLWRRCVLDFMFGYRVRTARAIHLFIFLWMLNWAVFLPPTAVERPLGFGVDAQEAWSDASPEYPVWPGDGGMPREEDRWGAQRAFFMALRVQVPFVDLFIDAEWKPADRPLFSKGADEGDWVLTYENYAAIMRIINLILVPVIIAGATGLLKPREAQYTGAS